MDDEYFVAELYSNDLLPGDLKNEIKSLTTSAKKATKFLDDVIQPAVTSNRNEMLNLLLMVMRNSGNNDVIQLAENIYSMINPILSSSNTTGYYTVHYPLYLLLSDKICIITGVEGNVMAYNNSHNIISNVLTTDKGMFTFIRYIASSYG